MVQGGVIMLPLACSLSYVVLKHMRLFLVPCFVSALVPSPKNSILPLAPPHTLEYPPTLAAAPPSRWFWLHFCPVRYSTSSRRIK